MLGEKDKALLLKIYNDIGDPGSFSSPEALYHRVRVLKKNFKGC